MVGGLLLQWSSASGDCWEHLTAKKFSDLYMMIIMMSPLVLTTDM